LVSCHSWFQPQCQTTDKNILKSTVDYLILLCNKIIIVSLLLLHVLVCAANELFIIVVSGFVIGVMHYELAGLIIFFLVHSL